MPGQLPRPLVARFSPRHLHFCASSDRKKTPFFRTSYLVKSHLKLTKVSVTRPTVKIHPRDEPVTRAATLLGCQCGHHYFTTVNRSQTAKRRLLIWPSMLTPGMDCHISKRHVCPRRECTGYGEIARILPWQPRERGRWYFFWYLFRDHRGFSVETLRMGRRDSCARIQHCTTDSGITRHTAATMNIAI